MTEELAEAVDDQYAESALPRRQQLAITLADAFLSADGPPPDDVQHALSEEFTSAELAELATGLALFHGFSKLLIATGCEPDEMDVTVLPTPGAASG